MIRQNNLAALFLIGGLSLGTVASGAGAVRVAPKSETEQLRVKLDPDAEALPPALSFEIEALTPAGGLREPGAGVTPGLHKLQVYSGETLVYEEAFLASTGWTTELRLGHSKAKGFSLREQIDVDYLPYKTNRAQLKSEGQKVLKALAADLSAEPLPWQLRVEVHTDNGGDEAKNLRLTQARADQVKKELVAKGILATRIEAVGMGSAAPLEPNDSKSQRVLNRRTEFYLSIRPSKGATEIATEPQTRLQQVTR